MGRGTTSPSASGRKRLAESARLAGVVRAEEEAKATLAVGHPLYIYKYTHTYICIHRYINTHIYVHTHTYTCIYIYIHPNLYVARLAGVVRAEEEAKATLAVPLFLKTTPGITFKSQFREILTSFGDKWFQERHVFLKTTPGMTVKGPWVVLPRRARASLGR